MLLRLLPGANANARPPDLVREANHRIANNLSVVAALMQLRGARLGKSTRTMSGEEVRLILEEFGSRLDTIARLHRMLTGERQNASVDIAHYLRETAEATVSCLSSTAETELHFVADPGCIVGPERALSLGLIVAELVTNAIKYAHPSGVAGEIAVACRKSPDGGLTIEVSDDGVGLPEGFDPMKDGELGFRLIRSLADQLGAAITHHSDSLGLSIALQMPRATPTQASNRE
jgi:two-component sensor histidine kinase